MTPPSLVAPELEEIEQLKDAEHLSLPDENGGSQGTLTK